MHGPPMSMFSIASASVTPGFATVCSNGYRLHTTRSISGSACSASVCHVLRLVALGEQAGVDRRVQRLHAAVEDFGEAGQLARCPSPAARRRRGPCVVPPVAISSTPYFVHQFAGEVDEAGLVGDAEQGAADRTEHD